LDLDGIYSFAFEGLCPSKANAPYPIIQGKRSAVVMGFRPEQGAGGIPLVLRTGCYRQKRGRNGP